MAKKKASDETNGSDERKPVGKRDHHRELIGAGWIKVGDSRPKGKPYILEEWMTPAKSMRMLKVYDSGAITVYNEQASAEPGQGVVDRV